MSDLPVKLHTGGTPDEYLVRDAETGVMYGLVRRPPGSAPEPKTYEALGIGVFAHFRLIGFRDPAEAALELRDRALAAAS